MVSGTTPDRVRAIAKHLTTLTDDQLQVYIDDAYQEVADLNVNGKYVEKLVRYLAAHLASLNVRQTQSESVGPMRKDYATQSISANTGLCSTSYGQEYSRLVKKYKPKINLTVI
ncbi:DUF4054 domain-containing protein [Heyndrickxia coagulans]|uniref:DUF4054 domain-containing protein n=1 Tax=Heyndrickxia coagulans TaxID=1398 RepID=UPI0022362A8D|nr:DUF4054 domain-containing protein [Heyndrickxia coagulans]UZH06394.1 DUF4054 domain-containing protein [Heyndrickxia coagulans]UZH06447.1 DUF4054 domain-containing protein [Heyndrickxia coagulans]